MNHLAAMEEKIVSDRMRQKLDDVNRAAQSHLSPIQDHINFTLQVSSLSLSLSLSLFLQAYFKCAHECFDRRRKQEEISSCVEYCSVPVVNAQQHFENDMAKFQERLNRSLMVCQDKFESAKLQKTSSDAINDLESCVNQTIDDSIKTLPHLVERLKNHFSIKD
ncbi:hypothetical protein JRO89_XS03G0033900 [Xanthoceras sorbifolium]|uniref:Protein FAM136A n=1 Tax=Xanthoceras sorbifolium TaxID=99658 RepID=A0ABQ8I9E6_9ROSI|nr:hypothetical protein JRO89_XS03G0033900 [Xanthoceras sorbifolium]